MRGTNVMVDKIEYKNYCTEILNYEYVSQVNVHEEQNFFFLDCISLIE